MFTRVVEIRTKVGKSRAFSTTLNEKVLPILRKQRGFVDTITMVSNCESDRILALSFWQSEADAERYNREQFLTVTQILLPLLETAPKVQSFTVDTSTTHGIVKGKAA
ncbi:MAG: antibiotic biosynthesis monooxygenase [Acidobacteriia bacterium]|nr:antibiotic biosynthesis monooxygenase [Terriglobia bacterium]